jgi:hypothetical protein
MPKWTAERNFSRKRSLTLSSFAAGTMTRFEHALYAERLPAERFNG